ncbi:MAG: PspA/IM30 family protein [Alkalispirochaeta sp.]
MGVFERIRRLIRSNVNDAVRRAEDPEKMLNQLILDMNKQLVEAKRNVATAISEEKRLLRQVEAQQQSAEQWEQRAMTALRAGKEDLAREALQRKKRESDYAAQLQEQYDKQHEAVESLKSSLRDLQGRIEEAQRKKNVLVARAKRAEAQKKIQEIITGLGNTSAFDAFDEMSKRVEQLEIENESMAELAHTPADRSLEEQIDALEHPEGDDAMLEDLRKKMDHGPADPDVDASLAELKKKLRTEE